MIGFGSPVFRRLPVIAAVMFFLVAPSHSLLAADGNDSISGLLNTVSNSVIGVLQAILILSALASLVFAILHMMRGERESARKLVYVILGLSVSFLLLTLFKVDGAPENISGEIGDIRESVAKMLKTALGVMCAVTLVLQMIKVMQGDEQSLRKVFTWALVGSAGMMLLDLFGNGGEIGTILSSTESGLKGLVTLFARIVQVSLALGALATLISVIICVYKGEREAASRLGWWVMGLSLGFTFVTVITGLAG